ncbi:MAG: hypothetical protein WCG19_05990 [Chlorobiaceae bacterium]
MTVEHAIEKLDNAIHAHAFRPEFIIVASRLIMELHAVGRITFRDGVLHTKSLVLDERILVAEDQSLNEFDFRLPILLI